MIDIKVRHNLDQVLDYIGKMHNDIQSEMSIAIEMAKEEVYNELLNTYEIGYDDLIVDVLFEGSNYKIIIDGINPYQLYNNLGTDMDSLFDIVENRVLQVIQQHLDNSGYGYGNKRL